MNTKDIHIFFDKLIIYFRNLIAFYLVCLFALGVCFLGTFVFLFVFIELPLDYLFNISVLTHLSNYSKDLFGAPFIIFIPFCLFNAKNMLHYLTDDSVDSMYNPFSLKGNNSYWEEKEKDKKNRGY